MVLNDDHFPPIASIHNLCCKLMMVEESKNNEGHSPKTKIKKVWIPKQYLIPTDDLELIMYLAKEDKRNDRDPHYLTRI